MHYPPRLYYREGGNLASYWIVGVVAMMFSTDHHCGLRNRIDVVGIHRLLNLPGRAPALIEAVGCEVPGVDGCSCVRELLFPVFG